MSCGIVIVNYNDWQTTVSYLERVKTYPCVDRIVVVDNCSTDDSLSQLRCICDGKAELIEAEQNGGYAAGNNLGARLLIEQYKMDVIVISNPDIEYDQKDLEEILDCLQGAEDVGLATGVIHNIVRGKSQVFSSFAWKVPSYWDMISNCFLTIYKFRRSVLKRGQYYDYSVLAKGKTIDVGCVSGCFFAIKSHALQAIGYFDERTFLYHEEDILGFQLKEAGLRSIVCTAAYILHREKPGKAKGIKKRKHIEMITLNSSLVYLRYYLRCGSFRLMLYKIVFWLGSVEKTIVRTLQKLKRRA